MPDGAGAEFGRGLATLIERLTLTIASWVLRHWRLLLTLAMALYASLPFAAPILLYAGYEGPARVIHTLFRPLCHQLPERSFFLFGPQATYTLVELQAHLPGGVPARWIGDAALGYKVAVCQRDVAIYGAMFAGMLFFDLFGRRMRRVSARWLLVGAAPMAIDGGGQLIGLWSSSPWSRVTTGALFGLVLIAYVMPLFAQALAGQTLTVKEKQC